MFRESKFLRTWNICFWNNFLFLYLGHSYLSLTQVSFAKIKTIHKNCGKSLFIKNMAVCKLGCYKIYLYKTKRQEDKMSRHISTCGLKSNNRFSGDTPIIHLLKWKQSFCKVSIKPVCAHLKSHMSNITPWSKTSAHTFLQLAPKWKCLKGTNWSKQEAHMRSNIAKHEDVNAGNVITSIQVHCRSRVPSLAKLCLSSPPSSNHLSKHSQSIQLISSARCRITHLR